MSGTSIIAQIFVPLSKLALLIFFSYVVPSLQSGGIGPERSGLINPLNVFHQSLGELLFDLSFSTNLSCLLFWIS